MDDLNKPETEADGLRAGALRLLKVRRQYQDLTGRTHALLSSQSSTPETTSELTRRNYLAAHHVCEVPGQFNES
jgi:hypothetical protein